MRRSARSIPATSSASGRTCCAPNVTTAARATMRRSSTWRPIPACTSIRRRRRERRRRPRLLRLRGSIRKAPATGCGASPGSSRATRQGGRCRHTAGGPAAGCRATGEPRGANRTARPFTARPAPAVDRSARSVRAAVGRYRHIRHIRHIRHDGHGTACRSRPHGARSVVRDPGRPCARVDATRAGAARCRARGRYACAAGRRTGAACHAPADAR